MPTLAIASLKTKHLPSLHPLNCESSPRPGGRIEEEACGEAVCRPRVRVEKQDLVRLGASPGSEGQELHASVTGTL